jgi:hypothetical protein
MVRALVTVCAAILLVTGCSDRVQGPVADGYTLQGVVLDALTGTPVGDVAVLIGSATDLEFREVAVTNANGEFTLKPSPATAPNVELLRLTKPGYVSLEVPARTAARIENYRYRLEVRLQPLPSP